MFKLLNHLNQCKANGPDNIPAVFLKTCSSELAKMLSFIIQQSLAKQTIPEDWRKALVTPAFKKGDRSNPENYRPISLTSICCKIAEHIIVSQTITHLDQHRILVDCHHGFNSCSGQSCVTTLGKLFTPICLLSPSSNLVLA